jgi:hypothetical protein
MELPADRATFTPHQLEIVNNAVAIGEELVSNYYKMSANQWVRPKYDVRTLADLSADEIVAGPFAQIIRYEGKRKGGVLGTSAYDFYKICIQDHTILAVLAARPEIELHPFALYVVTHELIHIVRFSRFQQRFTANADEKLEEERRVHGITHDILEPVNTPGMAAVLGFYSNWRAPIDDLTTIS